MKEQQIIEYSKKYGVPILRPQTKGLLIEKVKEIKPKKVLEIGTAIGYSTKTISNNSHAKIITIDHNKEYLKIAKKYLRWEILNSKVKIMQGDCLIILAKMLLKKKNRNSFDFVFIDGPKAQYSKILDLCLPLLSENGFIFIDDVLFHGYNETNKNQRFKTINSRLDDFIKKCKNHSNLCNFELNNIEDGIIFANKRINNE